MTTLLEVTRKTDKQIQLDVLAEIDRDWRFKPAELGVEVDDGIVTLLGTVSSYVKLAEAARIASGIPDVRAVANKLSVQVSPELAIDDTGIAKRVRSALEWAADVPDTRIETVVRNGIVTLTGTVDHWHQRRAAADAIGRIAGMRFMNDHIMVKPEPRSDQAIFEDIRATLVRRLPWASKAIDLTVTNGVVTLMGTVARSIDRDEAQLAAWISRGVSDVSNRIVVR